MDPVLKLKSTGPAVKELAALLASFGYLPLANANKTWFDHEVRAAVLGFQARHLDPRGLPLKVDGIVGDLTWWALRHPILPAYTSSKLIGLPAGADTSLLATQALRYAINELMAGAREVGSNNDGPYVTKYLNGLNIPPANWCAALISWCFYQAGPMPFKYTLGARDLRNQFAARGWIVKPPLHPGDLVFWWRGQPEGWMGHVGLVYEVKDGILYTIEGNKGAFPASVDRFDYVFSTMTKVLGFGRVPGGVLP